jgi:histidyl-tRNA synthetase
VFYEDATVRRKVIERLRHHFLQFGFADFDTAAIEHMATLERKSGPEVADQVCSFDDKGGRRLGLAFEFTASLGRVVASHPELQLPLKRYQIGKVWRYESPQSERYREFYQADIDIVGPYSLDCEMGILLVVGEQEVETGVFRLKIMGERREVEVPRTELGEHLSTRLSDTGSPGQTRGNHEEG